ncbi:MAG: hypothetical protein GY715_05785 [Planctomycetes bacterium]|nr:hypothetical protein [Planctomycetota bacterium]
MSVLNERFVHAVEQIELEPCPRCHAVPEILITCAELRVRIICVGCGLSLSVLLLNSRSRFTELVWSAICTAYRRFLAGDLPPMLLNDQTVIAPHPFIRCEPETEDYGLGECAVCRLDEAHHIHSGTHA